MDELQPTERELEALKVLWDRGQASIRDICEAMNDRGADLAYTTVLSLLQVMEQKGLVAHRREGKAYIYTPRIERTKTFRQMAAGFLDRVFDGAVDEYLVHALESRKLSPKELDELQSMITQAKKQAAKRSSKKGRQGDSR
jgi:predicted transcriptional regulator